MRATLKRLDPILIQAVIAAALSFAHIHDIAVAAGQDGWKAWAYPVSVDLLLVVAWKRLRKLRDGAGWFWFLVAMAASLGANIATSGVMDLANPPVWLRLTVAGWPAVAFLGGTLLVHGSKSTEEREAPAQEPASEPPNPPVEEEATEPEKEPQKAVLVSYADAADALGVAEGTVRGWAFNGHVRRHPGPTSNTVRVDLAECKIYQSRRLVGA
ncbi:hypothetical protein GCM10009548_02430 [Streptomyces malaysiensis subsp. malaysiensis]|uniref:DUF2637 domain-containing protein n=1 Tax=Streptomyces malaysiensis TaxID=92644 RepID=A0ABX6W6L9_STRMQ|nr:MULTISPECIES: DUF2637 domain-containing protein [Streptomyces]QPI56300.1 DUF2637 domain-containing protein [Streptomyces solisilvae]UHH17784.1 DUF2637 domain-containing protein [Streptomyces sp. HNM0561]